MENPTGTVTIHRLSKGFLNRTPAKVLIGNKMVELFPGQTQNYLLTVGEISLLFNKKKLLTFDLGSEEKVFHIKEGITEWRFILTYSVLTLLTIVILYFGIEDILNNKGYFGLFLGLWLVVITARGIKKDYFFIEEQ